MKSYSWPLNQLPGLSPKYCQQLARLNIITTADLLQQVKSGAGLQRLATDLHLPLRYIKKWVALSDLARVPQVGCRYNGLLLHTGIVSVAQLAQCSSGQLYSQVRRLHVATLTRSDLCPSPDEVTLWIQSAKQLLR